jgi:hypothetical protein
MFFARFPGECPYFSRVQITQSLTLNRLSMTDSDPSSKNDTYLLKKSKIPIARFPPAVVSE